MAVADGDSSLLPREDRNTVLKEFVAITKLAIPMFMAMVSWVALKVTDTAVLGHVGKETMGHVGTRYLDATALSDLWTSSTGVFIQSRVVGTFCGQAFGAGNKQLVGIWLQVSYVVLGCVMVPVAICWCLTAPVLRAVHKTPQEVSDASYYAVVLAICLPVRIGFSQLSSFFFGAEDYAPRCSLFFLCNAAELGGNSHFGVRHRNPALVRLGLSCVPVGHHMRGVHAALHTVVHLLLHLGPSQRMLAWMVLGPHHQR